MIIKQVRLSQQAKDQLSRLKGKTGIKNWNILCRWALCYSLAEKTLPTDIPLASDSNLEMSWYTFGGEYYEVYEALVKAWCSSMGLMSLARIKQVLTHLEEAKDVVFQIVQMNTSRNGDTAYIVRPITFEPIDKMKSFLLEIHDKYLDSKKGLDKMFSACIAYDGSADGKNVYYLETDNALIQKEYDLLLEALAAPAVEQDPLLMKAIASMITFSIEDDGEILPVKLISMQNPITTLKHKFFCNKGRFEEFSEKVLNLRTSIDVIIVGDKVYFLTKDNMVLSLQEEVTIEFVNNDFAITISVGLK